MVINTREDLRPELEKLVAEFKAGNAWYDSEEDVQTNFTVVLLKLLGWPSRYITINKSQEHTGERPDILLKNDAKSTVFVIESKTPKNKDELSSKGYEEQLFRYCKSEGKYWGVLTNFVEWRLYSSHLKSLYYRKIYAFHDLLWKDADKSRYVDLMSDEGLEFLLKLRRDVLWKNGGKFDDNPDYYPEESEIRKEFFENIRKWRSSLYENLTAKYGTKYVEPEIDLGAQRILDRMIFIEVCTDREVVAEDSLNAILYTTRRSFYDELKKKFARFDELFNTGLFAKAWIDRIEIDNPIIEPIITGISGIDFNELTVHVMGEVYEEYIGKELQKKTGAYYTPEYIVEYIVENTVGELLKGAKTEADISKIKVLDPACGSGSFLIKTFDAFIEAYERLDQKKKKGATLDLFDRARRVSILRDNIYGVDIDARAVEIAKLNLLIKALDGARYDNITGKRLLPDLSLNIRVGNSLIGGEQLSGEKEGQTWLFDVKYDRDKAELLKLRRAFAKALNDADKEGILKEIAGLEASVAMDLNEGLKAYFDDLKAVRAFNYTVAFPEVFAEGGFDAVIGNPPYGIVFENERKKYLEKKYHTFVRNNEKYVAFSERAVNLLKIEGLFGFIVPNTFILGPYFSDFKAQLLTISEITEIIDFGTNLVFSKSNVFTSLLFCKRMTLDNNTCKYKTLFGQISDLDSFPNSITYKALEQPILESLVWAPQDSLLAKLITSTEFQLQDIAWIKDVGLNYWTKGRGKKRGGSIADRVLYEGPKQNPNDKQYLKGRNVDRYSITPGNHWLRHNYQDYLDPKVDTFRFSPEFLEVEKIVYRQTADRIIACLEENKLFTDKTLHVIVLKHDWNRKFSFKFLLGILNSSLMTYLYRGLAQEEGRTFAQVKVFRIKQLPIHSIDFSNKEEKAIHDRMVELVQRMLDLNATEESRRVNAAEIYAIDSKIDDLVYELYGLTDEEIMVVESS